MTGRKLLIPVLCCMVATALVPTQCHATLIVSDDFDYADGPLTSNPDWTKHGGTNLTLLVSGGQAVVEHGTPSEDAHVTFASVVGLIYYGIDFSVDTIGTPSFGTDNEFFAHFRTAGADSSGLLDIVGPTGGGDYSLGIASDQGTADAIWATDLTFGTTYRAVVEFNQGTNQARLWIDATLASDTSLLGEDRSDPGDTVTQFALRQSDTNNSAAGDGETIRIDGLRVGTTFADVVSTSTTAIPEPSAFLFGGLICSMLGLAYGRRVLAGKWQQDA